MRATLKVENFGPIVSVELDLRNVNIFIGPQSSGKSTLAKLYCIFKSPLSFIKDDDFPETYLIHDVLSEPRGGYDRNIQRFKQELKKLNIHSFLKDNTKITYNSDFHSLSYENGNLILVNSFDDDLKLIIKLTEDKKFKSVNKIFTKYFAKLSNFMIKSVIIRFNFESRNNGIKPHVDFKDYLKKIITNEGDSYSIPENQLMLNIELFKEIRMALLGKTPTYIPAERIIITILKKAVFNLQLNSIPIPRHVLTFASEFENGLNEVEVLDLSFIKEGMHFKSSNGEDRVFHSELNSVLLSESSTGLQSLIPILIPLLRKEKDLPANPSFVIEEPEMNLYPKAQYNLIKFLESHRYDGIGSADSSYNHIYTTHSPYVLASFNNMLYAFSKSKDIQVDKTKIEEIIPKKNWLNPESFNAFSIKDGHATQIFNRKLGLIDQNEIDEASDYINDDFDRLLNL